VAWSVVFEGDGVGGDVHLRLVLGELHDTTLDPERIPQLRAARLARPVEASLGRGLAAGTRELHGRDCTRPPVGGHATGSRLQSKAMSDGPPTTPADERPTPRPTSRPRPTRSPPNDAARRMLVTTIGITALIAVGVLAWSVLRGDGDDGGSVDVEWDEITLIDRATGDITTYDREGRQIADSSGTGRILEAYVHDERLALVRSTELVLTDARDGSEPIVVGIASGSIVTPIETATSMHLLVGEPRGGNLLIVDVADGTVIDVAELAAPTVPKVFVETVQVDADGTRFAVADAANFQTIVVGHDIDGAVYLADQPVAVGEELIATSQVVNLQADIALVDLERRTEAMVPTELPRGGIMVDDALVMVSVDGVVFRIGTGDREANRIGEVPIPAGSTVAWALPSHLGERLVVGGTGFVAVVDLDGAILFSTTFADAGEPLRPHPAWRCLPVGGEVGHSLVALDSGEQLADLSGLTVTAISADGCTVVGERAGTFELVNSDGMVSLGALRHVAVAPNGDGVVWTTTTGRTELVAVSEDLELAEPIELAGAPTSQIVAFLRR
jgi:hypothetical protein